MSRGKRGAAAGPSIVNARFAPFDGQHVTVRRTWSPSSPLVGVFVAVEPAGATYVLHLRRPNGRSRFIALSAIVELAFADDVDDVPLEILKRVEDEAP
jgi:hypothetical protein